MSSLSYILPGADLTTSSAGPDFTSSSKSTSSETKASILRSLSNLSWSLSKFQSSSIRRPHSDDIHHDAVATSSSRVSHLYQQSSTVKARQSSILISDESASLGSAHASSIRGSSVISGTNVKSEARRYSVSGTSAALAPASGLAHQGLTSSKIHGITSSVPLATNHVGSVNGLRHSHDGNITTFNSPKHHARKTCQTDKHGNWKNSKSCSCIERKSDWQSLYSTGLTTTRRCISDPPEEYCHLRTIPALARPYTEPYDCCDRCEIAGDNVRLLYWPNSGSKSSSTVGNRTGIAHAARPSGIVFDGYTFTSPSVYISYNKLRAWTSCAGAVQWDTIAGSYTGGIQAFRPEHISSQRCIVNARDGRFANYCLKPDDPRVTATRHCFRGVDHGWEAINFEELANPPPDSVLYQRKRSCFPTDLGFKFEPKDARSMFLNPRIQLPNHKFRELVPEWRAYANGSCGAGVFGLDDPPRELGVATALTPAPESAMQDSDLSESVPLTTANAVTPRVTQPALPGEQLMNPQPAVTPPPKMPEYAKGSPEPPSGEPDHNGSDSVPESPSNSDGSAIPPQSPGQQHTNIEPDTVQNAPLNQDGSRTPNELSGQQSENSGSNPAQSLANVPSELETASGQQPGVTGSEPLQDTTSDPNDSKTLHDSSHEHDEGPDSDYPPKGPTRPDGSKASPGFPGGKQSNSLESDPMQHTSDNPDASGTSPSYAGGQPGNVASDADQKSPSGPSDSSESQDLGLDNSNGRPGSDSHKNDAPGGGGFQPEIEGSGGIELAQELSLQKLQNGDIVVGSSHTLSPGSAPLTISGHVISYVDPSHVAIDRSSVFNVVSLPTSRPIAPNSDETEGSSQPQPLGKNLGSGIMMSDGPSPLADTSHAAITLRPGSKYDSSSLEFNDGMVIQKLQNGKIVLDSSYTITPGPTPVNVLGHTIAYPDPSHIVVDHSSTFTLSRIPTDQALVIDAEDGNSVQQLSPLSRDSNGNILIDGTTLPLAPSGAASGEGGAAARTIAGHTFSLRGSDMLIEDTTKTFSIPPISNAYLLRDVAAHPTRSDTTYNTLPSASAYALVFDKIDAADLKGENTTMEASTAATIASATAPATGTGEAIVAYDPSSGASSLHFVKTKNKPLSARLQKYYDSMMAFVVGDKSASMSIRKTDTCSFFFWLLPPVFLIYHQF